MEPIDILWQGIVVGLCAYEMGSIIYKTYLGFKRESSLSKIRRLHDAKTGFLDFLLPYPLKAHDYIDIEREPDSRNAINLY
jgi:hypothetical protein